MEEKKSGWITRYEAVPFRKRPNEPGMSLKVTQTGESYRLRMDFPGKGPDVLPERPVEVRYWPIRDKGIEDGMGVRWKTADGKTVEVRAMVYPAEADVFLEYRENTGPAEGLLNPLPPLELRGKVE